MSVGWAIAVVYKYVRCITWEIGRGRVTLLERYSDQSLEPVSVRGYGSGTH